MTPSSVSLLSILSASGMRIVCLVLASLFAESAMTAPFSSADQACPPNPKPECFTQAKRDVAFIIDGSSSIAGRGQTYNIEIAGLARALRDRTVIPRDGSTALVVVLFNDEAIISVASDEPANSGRLKGIDSDERAENIAATVERLKCNGMDNPPAPAPCPSGNTNFDQAIRVASEFLLQRGRPNARRVLLMSTDGQPTDPGQGVGAAMDAQRKVSELDAILIGLDPKALVDPITQTNEFQDSQARVARLVFPQPPNDLPGAVLKIDAGPCNQPGALLDEVDCVRQVSAFAEHVRSVLRSDVLPLQLIVTTNQDTPADQGLSLRQAIERANCHGGKTTITFADSVKGKTIKPLTPLPALTAPDITIDGIDTCDIRKCDKCAAPSCVPSVIIDGAGVDATAGEAHNDGILIRSNHDVVRGLKIVNFKRAGVAVVPVCPADPVGCNRIELNVLVNNTAAGVLILDPAASQGKVATHNVGNTISRNTISGSITAIDLSGDSSTPNDTDDADDGPNALLNFPLIDSTTRIGDTVTLKGRAAASQVIEVFTVTRLRIGAGGPVIDAVEFIKSVTANPTDGMFTATDLPVSPTGFYTVTATDPLVGDFPCRNTSELTPIACTAPAIARITLEGDRLEFGPAIAAGEANKQNAQVKTFTVENIGCGPLVLISASIQRAGNVGHAIANSQRDDSNFFSLSVINADGTSSDFAGSLPITIAPGSENARRFNVSFHPVIPPITGHRRRLSASEVLPDTFQSVLDITHNGEGQYTIDLKAKVDTGAQLINPNPNPPRTPALVTMTRAGDIITVMFYVYDSDLSVNRVDYEFRDGVGRPVQLNQPDHILNPTGLVKGQSYRIEQTFSNATQHPEIATVRVIVSDGQAQAIAVSSLLAQTSTLSTQFARGARSPVLILPPAQFLAVPKKSLAGRQHLLSKRRAREKQR